MRFDLQSGLAMDLYRSRPLNLQRMIVGAHLRTTGVPGQGVDCPLLRHLVNLAGPAPPRCGVFAIKLWLRHNVLDDASIWSSWTRPILSAV